MYPKGTLRLALALPLAQALALALPVPGLDIRTELKGVFLSFFGLNLAVFIFVFSAWTMWFWSILAEKTCFGRILVEHLSSFGLNSAHLGSFGLRNCVLFLQFKYWSLQDSNPGPSA